MTRGWRFGAVDLSEEQRLAALEETRRALREKRMRAGSAFTQRLCHLGMSTGLGNPNENQRERGRTTTNVRAGYAMKVVTVVPSEGRAMLRKLWHPKRACNIEHLGIPNVRNIQGHAHVRRHGQHRGVETIIIIQRLPGGCVCKRGLI
eukprot:229768-Rhodomonas_salina.3